MMDFINPPLEKRFPALDFTHPPLEKRFPPSGFANPLQEKPFAALEFTNLSAEKRFPRGISQIDHSRRAGVLVLQSRCATLTRDPNRHPFIIPTRRFQDCPFEIFGTGALS